MAPRVVRCGSYLTASYELSPGMVFGVAGVMLGLTALASAATLACSIFSG